MDARDGLTRDRWLDRIPAAVSSRPILWIGGLVLCYYVTAVAGHASLMIPSLPSMAVLWAPNVILLVGFLLAPLRLWPAIISLALATQLAVAATLQIPIGRSVGMFTGNLSQPLLAAVVLRWLGHGADVLKSLRGATAFVVVAVLAAPALASLLSASVLSATGWIATPWAHWRLRFVTNVLSTLVLAPPILAFLHRRHLPRPFLPHVAEFLVLLTMLTASERFVESFVTPLTVSPLLFAPLPFLLWAAIRFGTAGLGVVLCFTVLFRYFAGTHPGHALTDTPDEIVATQLTLIAMSLPLIFLSALLTERRRTEEALRTGHARYGLATSAGSVGVWDWDLTTNDMYVDPALKRLLGYDDHEVRNHVDDWARLVHPDDKERVFAEVRAHMGGRSPVFDVQHRMLHKDGGIRWFLCRGVVVDRDERGATRIIGTDMDITLQKRAEQALEEAQARLARMTRLSDMGGLAATIAHEVNQPLCAIVANAAAAQRLLVRDDPDLAQVRAALEDVAADGKRASELIKRTRKLFEHGEMAKQPLDVNDVVRQALVLTRGTAIAGHVTVRTELGALPLVPADALQLQQVFCNLIVNASEAMIRINGEQSMTLTITTGRHNGGGVYATVSDTGDGFDGEDPERVFLPLVTTRSVGMGIGLAMSRIIVEAHGGKLWATPNKGPGATFHLLLPPE